MIDINQIFTSFKNKYPAGSRVADPQLAGELPASQWYQCVSLIKPYLREFNVTAGYWGDAIDYWSHPHQPLIDAFDKIPGGSNIQEGDIAVLTPNHIAIATGRFNSDNTQFEIYEQNGQTGTGTGTGGDAIRTRFVARSRLNATGVWRAKGATLNVTAPAPAPAAHAANHVGQILVLPSNINSWNVYRVGGPWITGTQIAKLNPAEFGGLEYEILGNPAGSMYIIQSQMFGQVAIYAGADTPATFRDKAAAAAAPAPAITVVPAPATPAAPANTVYTKLATALNLVTDREPTRKWHLDFVNDTRAVSAQDLPKGAPFVAVGKAQRTDGDKPCYFMSAEDFGQADVTGIPANNLGINTVDLTAAPTVQAEQVAVPATAAADTAPAAPAADTDTIKVNVVNDPNAWQKTYKAFLTPQWYVAKASTRVHDLMSLGSDQQLVNEGRYFIAGTFTGPDGIKYYRTATSAKNGTWYGIPEVTLETVAEAAKDNFVDHMLEEADIMRREIHNFTDHERKLIKAAGVATKVEGLFKRNKKGAK